MDNNLEKIKKAAINDLSSAQSIKELENIDIKYFGRKSGQLTDILRGLNKLSAEKKKEIGGRANTIKKELEAIFQEKKQSLLREEFSKKIKEEWIDVTLPGRGGSAGHFHPNTIIQKEIEDIFLSMGFMILDGPELESDYYNFEALNIPVWHPARDMQDTFYVAAEGQNDGQDNKILLRTQTSPVQIRALEKYGAPIKAVVPGRVFRNEATDASHEHTFYQMEGLMVDEEISISNLIAVMKEFLRIVFKKEIKIRLRPGYFPFVEPGFELDINCLICGGGGCSVCKHTGWLELMPCGMVHPNVLEYGGVDHEKYSGFAFGLGLTRLVMMKYGIDDIRLFHGGDLRFLSQF